jgi:hypothetical protein
MADPARIAAELLVAQQGALSKGAGGSDHCVLFTRIAVDVARARGVLAKALPVSVELQGEGGTFHIGKGVPPEAPPDAWDGHLVAIFDRRLMLDLSIDQAKRPELGLDPAPFVADIPAGFTEGGTLSVPVGGGQAIYTAQPNRRDYRDLPAWEQGTPEQIERLADAFLWEAGRRVEWD